jgi:hypothetical protein
MAHRVLWVKSGAHLLLLLFMIAQHVLHQGLRKVIDVNTLFQAKCIPSEVLFSGRGLARTGCAARMMKYESILGVYISRVIKVAFANSLEALVVVNSVRGRSIRVRVVLL